jgi:hypothetical protein
MELLGNHPNVMRRGLFFLSFVVSERTRLNACVFCVACVVRLVVSCVECCVQVISFVGAVTKGDYFALVTEYCPYGSMYDLFIAKKTDLRKPVRMRARAVCVMCACVVSCRVVVLRCC